MAVVLTMREGLRLCLALLLCSCIAGANFVPAMQQGQKAMQARQWRQCVTAFRSVAAMADVPVRARVEALGMTGICHRELGELRESLAALRESLAASNNAAPMELHLELSTTHLQLGNWEDAVREAAKAVDGSGRKAPPQAFLNAAVALARAGGLAMAKNVLVRCLHEACGTDTALAASWVDQGIPGAPATGTRTWPPWGLEGRMAATTLLPLPAYLRVTQQYVNQFHYPVPAMLLHELVRFYEDPDPYALMPTPDVLKMPYVAVFGKDSWAKGLREATVLGSSFRCFYLRWLDASHCLQHARMGATLMVEQARREGVARPLPPLATPTRVDAPIHVAVISGDIHRHPMYDLLSGMGTWGPVMFPSSSCRFSFSSSSAR